MEFWRRKADTVEVDGELVRLQEDVQRLDVLSRNLLQQSEALLNALKTLRDETDRGLRSLVKEHQDDYARMQAAIDVVRGIAVGARGGRPPREEKLAEQQALALGQRVIAACSTPEGALEFAAEIQARAAGSATVAGLVAPNGHVSTGMERPKASPV